MQTGTVAVLSPTGSASYRKDKSMGRFNLYCRKVLVMSCLLVPAMAQADLTVIHDSGHTHRVVLEVFKLKMVCHSKVRFQQNRFSGQRIPKPGCRFNHPA